MNAYALIPITLPSHAAMFYSLPPHLLKVYNNTQRAEIPLWSVAELLDKNGYRTGAVISLGTLEEYWGLGKGFDDYIENFRDESIWFKTAEEVNQDAMDLISKRRKNRAFFWIHYSDPHEPYFPPSYRGGSFRLKINREEKITAGSSEITHVELPLVCPPGETRIELETELPARVLQDPRLEISYINLERFSFAPDSGSQELDIVLPGEWMKKEVKGHLEYSTRNLRSELVVINPTSQELFAQLAFSHKILPSVDSMRILYDEEIRYMDSQIGLFMDFLKAEGIYDNSVFILMGDHGEGLGEFRDHIGHIDYLYKPYAHVPLLLWGKGIPSGKIVTDPVSNLHIAPTILEMAGLERPAYMLGEPLTGPVRSERLLLETYAPEAIMDSFSVIDYPYQLIYYPDDSEENWEYFRLDDEKTTEEADLEDSDAKVRFRAMRDYLEPLADRLNTEKRTNPKLPKRAEEMLKSLGYIK